MSLHDPPRRPVGRARDGRPPGRCTSRRSAPRSRTRASTPAPTAWRCSGVPTGGVFYHAFAGFEGDARWSARRGWSAARSTTCTWPTCGPGSLPASAGGATAPRWSRYAEQHLARPGPPYRRDPDLDRRRPRRLPAVRRAAGLLPGADAGRASPAAADGRAHPRPGWRRRRPATARAYTLRTVVGPIPDDLVPGFLDLYNLMNVEMPTGDLELEEGRRTPEVQAAAGGRAARPGPHPADRPGVRPRRPRRSPTPTWSPVPPTATTPGSTSGRRSCGPTTAATGWAWPSSAR